MTPRKKKVNIDSINGPNGIFKKILVTTIGGVLIIIIVNVLTAYNTSKQVPVNTEDIKTLKETKADKTDVKRLEHTYAEIRQEGKDINKKLDQFILLHINSDK